MLEIKFPKMWRRFGYDVEEPEVIRRRKVMIASKRDKRFGLELESFGRNLPPLMLSSDTNTRHKLKKIRKDYLWWVQEGKWL